MKRDRFPTGKWSPKCFGSQFPTGINFPGYFLIVFPGKQISRRLHEAKATLFFIQYSTFSLFCRRSTFFTFLENRIKQATYQAQLLRCMNNWSIPNVKKKILLFVFAHLIALCCLGEQIPELYFEKISVANVGPSTAIAGISKDSDGFMWFGSWDGLYRYDGIGFKEFRNADDVNNQISSNRIRTLFTDKNKRLCVFGFDQVIACYDPVLEQFETVPDSLAHYQTDYVGLAQKAIKEGKQVGNGQCRWTIEKGMLWQTNLQSGERRQLKADLNQPGSLSSDFVTWLYLDDQAILWVGMMNGDINFADLNRKSFQFHYNRSWEDGALKDNGIRAIYDDGRYLWLASNNRNINRLDQESGRIVTMAELVAGGEILDGTRTIVPDGRGNLWFGSSRGMFRYRLVENQLWSYRPSELFSSTLSNGVFAFCNDSNGDFWVGLYNSIARYEPAEDRFEWFDLSEYIHDHSVMVMLEDRHQNFWLGTEGDGVLCLKRTAEGPFEDQPVSYRFEHNKVQSLPGDRIYSLHEDQDGMIWVASSNGLCFIDPKGDVHRMDDDSGLSTAYISAVTGDEDGNIWVSHKRGLARYNSKSGDLRHFDPMVDRETISFLDNSCFRSPGKGKIYFGGQNGWLSFSSDKIPLNPIEPEVRFTGLEVLNRPVEVGEERAGRVLLEQALPHTKELTLSFWERSFAFSFAALSFSEPANNRYQYKLEGVDNGWIATDASHAKAVYSSLPAGNYVLRVRAANADGLWSPTEARMEIRIKPPFWASTPAYFFYVFFVAALLFWLYYFLLTKEKFRGQLALEKVEKDKIIAIDKVKFDFYTNVSHEFRTPLSLIIDPVEKLQKSDLSDEKRQAYLQLVHRNAIRLLNLINQLLDFRKIETQHERLSLTNADWVELARQIAETFQLAASKRQIALTIESSESSIFGMLDRDKFEKILVNLLSNAVKYTPDGGLIELKISEAAEIGTEQKRGLVIEVKDSGIGIPEEALPVIFDPFVRVAQNKSYDGKSSGIGLALTKKLVELLGGSIRVKSKSRQGSLFIVELPLAETVASGELLPEVDQQLGETPENSTERALVLIADDNEEILTYLEAELEDQFKVVTARNGKEAKLKATNLIPDVIISDVMMPEMDGIEFCNKIKTDIRTSHIPIVLLTARQSQESRIDGLEKGADAYMTKPFSSSVLKAQVKSLIENRRKVQRQFISGTKPIAELAKSEDPEQVFLLRSIELVRQNMKAEDFSSEKLADELKLSQRQLYRKLNALTGQTVHQFITSIRMNRAKELLLNKEMSVSDVSYEVGYNDLSTFSRSFSKQFGKSPSAFMSEK